MADPSYSSILWYWKKSVGYLGSDERCPGALAAVQIPNSDFTHTSKSCLKQRKWWYAQVGGFRKERMWWALLPRKCYRITFKIIPFPTSFHLLAYLLNQGAQQSHCSTYKTLSPGVWHTKQLTLKQEATILSIWTHKKWKDQQYRKRTKEHMAEGGTLSKILSSPTAGSTIYKQLGNFFFTQEKDDFVVHIKVEMTKTDCITPKERCFLMEGDRQLA